MLLLLLLFLLLVPGLKPVRTRWYKSNDTPTRCRTFRSSSLVWYHVQAHVPWSNSNHTCPWNFFTVKRGQQKWQTSSSMIASKRVKTILRVLPPVTWSLSRNNSYCCRFQIVVAKRLKLLSTFCNNLSQPTTRHGVRACKQKEIRGARSTALRALPHAHCCKWIADSMLSG